jgi:hypothetical protein
MPYQDGSSVVSPSRIQRKRTKGWRMPDGAIHVARPSRWGNPWSVEGMAHIATCPSDVAPYCIDLNVKTAVGLFRIYSEDRDWREPQWLAPLRGHDLACWCPLDQPCHADVLLELANG